MTFSLSKCPPKPRTKATRRTSSSTNVYYYENGEKKAPVLGDITSILQGLDGSPVRRKRRRRRSDHDLPIPTFASKRSAIDLSFLESPVEKEKHFETTDFDAQCLPTKQNVDTTEPTGDGSALVDSDDSDIELLRSSSVFRKISSHCATEGNVNMTMETAPMHGAEIASTPTRLDNCNELSEEMVDAVAQNATSTREFDNHEDLTNLQQPCCPSQVVELPNVASPTLFNDRLFLSLDNLYLHADINSVTVKDIIEALEAEFEISFDRKVRKLIKKRLTNLIAGKVAPMAASPPCTADECVVVFNDEAVGVQVQLENDIKELHPPETKIAMEKQKSARQKILQPGSTDKLVVISDNHPKNDLSVEPAVDPVELSHAEESADDQRTRLNVTNPEAKPPTKPRTRSRKVHAGGLLSPEVAPIKQTRKRKGTCSLCATCSCTIEKDPAVVQNFANLSHARTEIEIEKSLIKRQKKLEKTVDKYESDLDLVTRELKRHRRGIIKRRCAQLQQGTMFNDSRFLPDVDVWDVHLQNITRGVVSTDDVKKTQLKLFGKVKGGQPTLTQMMGIERTETSVLEPILEELAEDLKSQTSDTLDVGDDEANILPVSHDDLEEPAEPVHRVTWRNGNMEAAEAEHSIWSAVHCGEFASSIHEESSWDRMFAERIIPETENGLDALLELFGAECAGPSMQGGLGLSQVSSSQLSQSAQNIAATLEVKVTADPVRLSKIEGACPNWRENIRFALRQREDDDIKSALENIRESKAKLSKVREAFLSAWKRQRAVLQLYEMSLSASLRRVNGEKVDIIRTPLGEACTDVESDAETVTEFSPLSQEEATGVELSNILRPIAVFKQETQDEE